MTAKSPYAYSCWEPGPDDEDGCGTTCMLTAGHKGPHEFTRDDEIIVRFAPFAPEVEL